MRSYTGTEGTIFHHNSGFNGYVIINVGENQIKIPATDLLEFIAYQYVAVEKISKIEQMEWKELLSPNK